MRSSGERHLLTAAALIVTVTMTGCARGRQPIAVPEPPADPRAALARAIHDATRLPGVTRGVWGIVVHSLDRDERLFELNPSTLLVPASAAKLVSVASAVDAVGWDYRFETTLSVGGPGGAVPDERGVLHGDVLITGSGDPTIGGRAGDDLSAWVEALRALGIRRVEGRIIGDDDRLEEPRPALAWAWDDVGYPTGALFGALNLLENRMSVTIAPAAAPHLPAILSTDAFAAPRPLLNRAVTGEASTPLLVWAEQRPGERALTIAGSVPAGAPAARLSVSVGNPTLWFASVLRERLIDAGIPVLGEAVDVDEIETPIDRGTFSIAHVHRSRPLSEIAQPLLKESINLYAEAALRLNVPAGVYPTNDAALAALQPRLASWGIPPDAQQLVDGSGLSRRNVITADALVTVLRRMHDPAGASPWMHALPAAGVDGSLESRMRGTPAEGRVRAKTGTMSNVRALAGYATAADGERLAFAVLVNNFEGAGAAANSAVDAIAIALASFRRGGP
jgi:D-alanyl-D-alanine carboxypeptidase/D-alanyl-D-alanine-endopeptidase (penicillin-binding protein 4)